MLLPESQLGLVALAAVAAPLAAFLAVGAFLFALGPPSEKAAHRGVLAALLITLAASVTCAVVFADAGGEPISLPLGVWFHVADYDVPVGLLVDEDGRGLHRGSPNALKMSSVDVRISAS